MGHFLGTMLSQVHAVDYHSLSPLSFSAAATNAYPNSMVVILPAALVSLWIIKIYFLNDLQTQRQAFLASTQRSTISFACLTFPTALQVPTWHLSACLSHKHLYHTAPHRHKYPYAMSSSRSHLMAHVHYNTSVKLTLTPL